MTRRKKKSGAHGKTPAVDEPYWAPLPRQKFSTGQMAGIILRYLIPLGGVLFFDVSAENFLLLSLFNIAFNIACIGTIGISVSTMGPGDSPNVADKTGAWISLLLITIAITLLLTAMFGWLIVIMVSHTAAGFLNPSLYWSAMGIILCGAPEMVRQYNDDASSGLSETQRKQRDQPKVLVHVFCAGALFVLSGYAVDLEHFGLIMMAVLATALFIFRDLRPDLMRELTRPSNRPPGLD